MPEFYNQLGAMHGTIMVFLAIVPLAVGGFGNYLIPLMIGAPDMAFPRLNMWSYWIYLAGGRVMVASFFLPGGAANSGWTSYAPLAVVYVLVVPLVGQTPGMRLLGLRLVSTTGDPVPLPRAVLRFALLALLLPAVIVDPDGRGLHDKAAGTVVVRA